MANSHKYLYAVLLAAITILVLLRWNLLLNLSPRELQALDAGLLATFATILGTLPVFFFQKIPQKVYDVALGFCSGLMLSACIFSLILPSIEAAKSIVSEPLLATSLVGIGILLGAVFLLGVDLALPNRLMLEDIKTMESQSQRSIWLFVLAIFLHNIPEGLAIGASFAGNDVTKAQALSWGIAIQDMPEGMVIALALRAMGKSPLFAASLGTLSGLVEPLAAVVAVLLIGQSSVLLPIGMALTAGAMLYVISHEIIPESHRAGHKLLASASLMLGFVLMLILDAR